MMKCVFLFLTLVVIVRLSQAGDQGLGDSKSYRPNRIRRQVPVSVDPGFSCIKITPDFLAELKEKHGLPDLAASMVGEGKGPKPAAANKFDIELFYIFGDSDQPTLDYVETVEYGAVPSNSTIVGLEYSKFGDRKNCIQLLGGGNIKGMNAYDRKSIRGQTSTSERFMAIISKTVQGEELLSKYKNYKSESFIMKRNESDTNTSPPTIWMFFMNATATATVATTSTSATVVPDETTTVVTSVTENTTVVNRASGASATESSSSSYMPVWILVIIVVIVVLGAGLVFFVLRKPKVESRIQTRHGADRLSI